MSLSPHRAIVDDLHDALAAVPELAGAKLHRHEPRRHDADGRHLAVWFEGVAVDEKFNTTGSLGLADLYAVRYWQPDPSASRRVVDEDAAADIESIMNAAVLILMANQEGIGGSYATRFAGARTFNGSDDEPRSGQVAGWEIAVTARRDAVYT